MSAKSDRLELGQPGTGLTAAVCTGKRVSDSQTTTKPETSESVQTLPPYKVILHNDDVNSFEHVVHTVLELTPLNELEALEKTLEAHETGQSILLITHKERAELYVDQFATKNLTATCEPDC